MTIGTQLKTALYVKFALIHPDSGVVVAVHVLPHLESFSYLKRKGSNLFTYVTQLGFFPSFPQRLSPYGRELFN